MRGRSFSILAAAVLLVGALLSSAPTAAAQDMSDETEVEIPQAVTQVAKWAAASDDVHGVPFMVIDKVSAQVFVYGPDGELWAETPALLGLAVGDDSSPGVGERELSDIAPEERTTPAGRFVARMGAAPGGRKVFWIDYATAISMHPVINSNRREQRPERLKSPSPEDNRITFGCINVSPGFYNTVVRPAFTGGEAIVYILPEERSLTDVFPGLARVGPLGEDLAQR